MIAIRVNYSSPITGTPEHILFYAYGVHTADSDTGAWSMASTDDLMGYGTGSVYPSGTTATQADAVVIIERLAVMISYLSGGVILRDV